MNGGFEGECMYGCLFCVFVFYLISDVCDYCVDVGLECEARI